MNQLLTQKQKIKKLDYSIQRDGFSCLYCKEDVDPNNCVIDHLNDDPHCNEEWNLIATHEKCNLDKRFSYDYKILAAEKAEENKNRVFKPQLEDDSLEASTEIQISVNNRQIAK